jgi:hypothetical protein
MNNHIKTLKKLIKYAEPYVGCGLMSAKDEIAALTAAIEDIEIVNWIEAHAVEIRCKENVSGDLDEFFVGATRAEITAAIKGGE